MKRLLAVALSLALLALAMLCSVAGGANYCLDSENYDVCPDIMHTKHQNFMNDCKACHNLANSFIASGTFFKDSSKGAFLPGGPNPIFSPSGKWINPRTNDAATCSNIACHYVQPGYFTYYIWDWGIETLVPVTVYYGGMSSANAKWVDDAASNCNSCHGNPPKNSNYNWHSGSHGNTVFGANNCETCHPDARSTTTADGRTIISNFITAPSQHANGTVDVVAVYTSGCFSCH